MKKRAMLLLLATMAVLCMLAFVSCEDTQTEPSGAVESSDTFYDVSGENTDDKGSSLETNEKKVSEGLAYRLVNNKYYVVTGIGTCQDTDICIGSTHNGLPVKMIDAQAFEGNEAITGVTIPNSVTDIGYGAFRDCSALTKVCLSNNLTYLSAGAFYECQSLECTEYEGALYIGSAENPYLFLVKAKDTGIVTCEINENTRFIGDMAFYRCASLERLVIPMGIVDIGSHAFSRCDILQYNEYDNGCYLGNEENPYLVLASLKSEQITSCQINESTVFIGSTVFENCDKLESIVIPKSVRTICASAFWECGGLKSIIFEEGSLLTNIAPAAFCDCGNLESVILPSGVKRIAYGVFYGCKRLTSVFVPESVEYVEAWAFMLCPNLTIRCEASSQPNEWSPDWNGHNYTVEWSSSLEN